MKTLVRGRLTVLRGAVEGTPFTQRFSTISLAGKGQERGVNNANQ
jgi:hypothetical protein